jgi:fibronectin type III domain protein
MASGHPPMTDLLKPCAVACAALMFAGCSASAVPTRATPAVTGPVSQSPASFASDATPAVSWICISSTSGVLKPAGCDSRQSYGSRTTAAALSAPIAPSQLVAVVVSNRVTLTWAPPSGGDPPTSYVVEAGSSTGLVDLANFDTGSASPSLIADGLPARTYFVRVRAKNGAGASAPSNETIVTVGDQSCGATPSAPTQLQASVLATTVTLTWQPPGGACPPDSYRIEAGTAPAQIDIGTVDTTGPQFVASTVGRGSYFIRVRSRNARGLSPPSNEAHFVIGLRSFISYRSSSPEPASLYQSGMWTAENSTFYNTYDPTGTLTIAAIPRSGARAVVLSIAARLGAPFLQKGTYENATSSTLTTGPFMFFQTPTSLGCFGAQHGRFVVDDVEYGRSLVPTRLHITFEVTHCPPQASSIGEVFLADTP